MEKITFTEPSKEYLPRRKPNRHRIAAPIKKKKTAFT
jgi:hypothetical protein